MPLVMSLDGNFGLVHKRSAGRSFEPALHGNRMFVDDQFVKRYMDEYSIEAKDDDVVRLILF